MSYTPTEWHTGDVITAQKLNHIEQGVDDMYTEPYVPTEWVTGDVITAEKLNHIEQGIVRGSGGGDTVIAPEQTATIVNEQAVLITAPGWEYNEILGMPINWVVTINGTIVPYDEEEESYFSPEETSTSDFRYMVYRKRTTGLVVEAYAWDGEDWVPVETTTVTVSITEPASGPIYPSGVGSDYVVVAPKQTLTTDDLLFGELSATITLNSEVVADYDNDFPINWVVFVNGNLIPYDAEDASYSIIGVTVEPDWNNQVVLLRIFDDGVPIEATATVTILQPAAGPEYADY